MSTGSSPYFFRKTGNWSKETLLTALDVEKEEYQ